MSLCSRVEEIRRKDDENRRVKKPLPVSLDVVRYAAALKAHTLTAADVPERLRDAVQEYLVALWQQKEKQ